MTAPVHPRPTVNIPAVIGVVVVVLAIIVAWVVTDKMGSDEVAISPGTTVPSSAVTTTAAPSTVPDPTTVPTTKPPVAPSTTPTKPTETSPLPLPTNVANPNGSHGTPSLESPTTTKPAAKAGTKTPSKKSDSKSDSKTDKKKKKTDSDETSDTVGGGSSGGAGDLGIKGHPIQRPNCDGAFVTIVASAVGDDVTASAVSQLLDQYEGSSYLRTDKSCSSFTQSVDGEPVYVVYLGPFAQPEDACAARSKRENAYVKRLTNSTDEAFAACS